MASGVKPSPPAALRLSPARVEPYYAGRLSTGRSDGQAGVLKKLSGLFVLPTKIG
jgi:hypothetical protein